MRLLYAFFSLAVLLSVSAYAQSNGQIISVYTGLGGSMCNTLSVDNVTGNSVTKCPGVGGFYLLVADDDARMSITIVTPDHKEYPLDYWEVITHSFSNLGRRAEWRVVRRGREFVPVSLIVRVDASEQEEPAAPRKRSYLAVAKITPPEICVTDKIPSVRNANQQARRAADNSKDRPCLKSTASAPPDK